MRALSLFSGAGGDTLGMVRAGLDVVGYVENNPAAIQTHERNFPGCKLIGKDIRNVPDEVFASYKGSVDVIFGGFPCQSFSHAGKKRANDSRGFLYEEFVRAARLVRPRFILGENVKGLLTRKTPTGDLFIDRILSDFSSIGYKMSHSLFDMSEYGLPQKRQRLILCGALERVPDLSVPRREIRPVNRDVVHFSLENALEVEGLECECVENPTDRSGAVGKPPTNLVKCHREGKLSYKTRATSTHGCIVDLDDVARTIICSYGRMPRLFVPVRNARGTWLRPYTVLELQRLQGFPDDFEFTGKYAERVSQIGNAVPPMFVEVLVRHVLGAH